MSSSTQSNNNKNTNPNPNDVVVKNEKKHTNPNTPPPFHEDKKQPQTQLPNPNPTPNMNIADIVTRLPENKYLFINLALSNMSIFIFKHRTTKSDNNFNYTDYEYHLYFVTPEGTIDSVTIKTTLGLVKFIQCRFHTERSVFNSWNGSLTIVKLTPIATPPKQNQKTKNKKKKQQQQTPEEPKQFKLTALAFQEFSLNHDTLRHFLDIYHDFQ